MILSKDQTDAVHSTVSTAGLAAKWHGGCNTLECVSFPGATWLHNDQYGWLTMKDLEWVANPLIIRLHISMAVVFASRQILAEKEKALQDRERDIQKREEALGEEHRALEEKGKRLVVQIKRVTVENSGNV
jgi:hypothetical protein